MDQKRIGSFISKLRKEKNLTQQELADKLHVTDRAVSHWENGRRLPDISLLKDISNILGVSVNELLSAEKYTEKNSTKKTDENLINSLRVNKKNNKLFKLIITMLIVLIIFLVIGIILKVNKYPKIRIYNINVKFNENNSINTFDNYNLKMYDIHSIDLCDIKGNCYDFIDALDNNQVNRDRLIDYFNKQFEIGNINGDQLNDGGTLIFTNNDYQFIFCNTLDGNKDILIGDNKLIDTVDNICGKPNNKVNKFVRTYHVKSIKESKNATMDVELSDDNKTYHTVNILNTYKIIPGHTYDFTFATYNYFDDTIENIFKYSYLYNVNEVYKDPSIYRKDEIVINLNNNKAELQNIDNVYMTIKQDTLTTSGVTIIIDDKSEGKYLYGDEYRIDKYENEWKELSYIKSNIAWNLKAYIPDKLGKLEFKLNWKDIYGELTPGRYRIVKKVLIDNQQCGDNCPKYYISTEFRI